MILHFGTKGQLLSVNPTQGISTSCFFGSSRCCTPYPRCFWNQAVRGICYFFSFVSFFYITVNQIAWFYRSYQTSRTSRTSFCCYWIWNILDLQWLVVFCWCLAIKTTFWELKWKWSSMPHMSSPTSLRLNLAHTPFWVGLGHSTNIFSFSQSEFLTEVMLDVEMLVLSFCS